MKSPRWFIVLSAATLLPAMPLGAQAPLAAQAPSIVEPKVERHQGPPLWISAEAVADEEKIIKLDLLDSPALETYVETQRRELEERTPERTRRGEKPSVATIPSSECKSAQYSSGQSHRGGTGAKSTLSDLATNSRTILRGTIRTIDLGFDGGVPASLLGVEVSETIKGYAPESLFYVLYPVAHFRIGPLYFCSAKQGFEPRPGDELLLFAYSGTVDRDEVLYAPRLDQMLFQGQDGTLFLPSPIKDTPEVETARTLDDLIGRLPTGNADETQKSASGHERSF